jgi:multidrug resistance efflux pump
MKRLLAHEAVSQQEFEVAQTAYVQAKSQYENSKDLLQDTKLRAPFAGVIERTYVDAYQRVSS